ncbi:MAG: hypothetical protein ACE5DO_07320 [Desulfobacterales bacterium]
MLGLYFLGRPLEQVWGPICSTDNEKNTF